MKQIMIEVAEATANSWENISPKARFYLQESFEQQIKDVSEKLKKEDFEVLLERIRDQAEKNGLTEEILQKLLHEE